MYARIGTCPFKSLLLAAFICFILIIPFAGCGSDDDTPAVFTSVLEPADGTTTETPLGQNPSDAPPLGAVAWKVVNPEIIQSTVETPEPLAVRPGTPNPEVQPIPEEAQELVTDHQDGPFALPNVSNPKGLLDIGFPNEYFWEEAVEESCNMHHLPGHFNGHEDPARSIEEDGSACGHGGLVYIIAH